MTYEAFEAEILQLMGLDLRYYKKNQMVRRIDNYMKRQGVDSYDSFLELLRVNEVNVRMFFEFLTINVTECFREPEHWAYVAEHVLPKLPDDAVIWSNACSTGEEAFSLAISIAERRPFGNIKILATDIDDKVLDVARHGVVYRDNVKNVPDSVMHKYFTKAEKGYKVCDEIRSRIDFQHLNLLSDPYPQNCDLIVCRNVLIYFHDETKYMLYRKFHDSLKPGGYLFLGQAEQILHCLNVGMARETAFLYKRL